MRWYQSCTFRLRLAHVTGCHGDKTVTWPKKKKAATFPAPSFHSASEYYEDNEAVLHWSICNAALQRYNLARCKALAKQHRTSNTRQVFNLLQVEFRLADSRQSCFVTVRWPRGRSQTIEWFSFELARVGLSWQQPFGHPHATFDFETWLELARVGSSVWRQGFWNTLLRTTVLLFWGGVIFAVMKRFIRFWITFRNSQ